MPQLDFATYASQIFWLAVTFGLLYIVMAKSALPTVREVLQSRQARITDDLKKAEKLKTEAEAAEADFTSATKDSRAKAVLLLNSAREKAAKESEKRNEKLDETFSRQAKEAEHRIEIIRKETADEMHPVIIDVAQAMLKKLVDLNVDSKTIEKSVAELVGRQ